MQNKSLITGITGHFQGTDQNTIGWNVSVSLLRELDEGKKMSHSGVSADEDKLPEGLA